ADRLAGFGFQSVDEGLRDRPESGFDHGFAEVLRYQRFQHVIIDLAGEAVANHAGRHFAFAESGHSRLLGIGIYETVLFFVDHLERDLDGNLSAAGFVHAVRAVWRLVKKGVVGDRSSGCGFGLFWLALSLFGGVLLWVQRTSLSDCAGRQIADFKELIPLKS